MNTSSPVLILPQKRVRIDFERIAIAWNNGQTESADALVKTAREEKAGMLVCGAYTRRSLTSQRLFGGVTQHLLSGSDFPVIMMHV